MNIVIEKDNIKGKISKWLSIDIEDIYEYINLLLLRLGFNDEDIINIVDIDNNNLYFIVNNDKNYSINLYNDSNSKYPLISFNNKTDNIEYGYQCIYKKYNDYLTLYLNPFKYVINVNNKIIKYEINNEWVEYRVPASDKILEFRLSKPYKYINNYGYYTKYEVEYHRGIINYFSKIDYNYLLSIIDVYKDLCILGIGDDINKYDDLDLRILKIDEYGNSEVEELIQLQNGNLFTLIINRNGKTVSYNSLGSWSCDMKNSQVIFDIYENKDMVSFNSRVNFKEDTIEYNKDIAYDEMEVANSEVIKVKRLIKEMFPLNKNR